MQYTALALGDCSFFPCRVLLKKLRLVREVYGLNRPTPGSVACAKADSNPLARHDQPHGAKT
jgi:hypothetical protein